MAVTKYLVPIMASMYPLVGAAGVGSLADIDHVVLFMQGWSPIVLRRDRLTDKYRRKQGLRPLFWHPGWSPWLFGSQCAEEQRDSRLAATSKPDDIFDSVVY